MTNGIQTKRIQNRDWEDLSAYLDGQLAPNDRSRLEKRLQASVELRTALDELRRTRSVLRSQPRLRAPRNFTLTLEMVGKRKLNWGFPSLFPALGMASALASALFIVVLLFDLLGGGAAGAPSMVAMQVTQESSLKSYAATEAPAAALESGRTLEAAPRSPGIQGQAEAPAAAEVPAATEAPAMALEAEEAANALAATEPAGTPAIPTPAPMLSDTVPGGQDAFTQTSPASTPYPAPGVSSEDSGSLQQSAPTDARQADQQPQPQGFWTPLRLLEAGLALIALAAGTAAFLIRRVGSG